MRTYLYIIALACALPMATLAQERAMSLQECIGMAMEHNLSIKAGTVSVSKAHDLQGTAIDMEQTAVTLSQDPTSGGSPDNGVSINQSIEFPTVYAARRKYLKAETAVAQSNLNMTRNEVVRDVSAAYYTLLHQQKVLEILQAQDSVYSRFVTTATARCKAGETRSLEMMNAERLLSENRIEMQKAANAYAAARLRLGTLIGTDMAVTPTGGLQPIALADGDKAAVAFEQTPIGEMYAAQAKATERNISLVKQGYMPRLSVGFTTQLLIKGFNPYDIERERFGKGNLMAVEVGVSVPLFWGGQKAKVKAARRDGELAEINRLQAKRQQDAEYRDCQNELMRAEQALTYFDRQGNQQASRMSRLSQIAYDNGEIGYVEYVQNQQTALGVQRQYADAINDYNQAVIRMNYIKGNK